MDWDRFEYGRHCLPPSTWRNCRVNGGLTMIQRLVLVLAVVVSGLLGSGRFVGGAGTPLYPDLQTAPPTDLFFEKRSDGTYLLRFSNTVKNTGEGRLEIQGNPKPRKRDQNRLRQIYQNLYDAPVGGNRAIQKPVSSDAIYHAGHQHFHFADFAKYDLLVKSGTGYALTEKKGNKTSFCIMDTTRFQGTYASVYRTCGGELQGLTPGWGDTYDFTLADQWVVLGTQPLPDGEYALQSVADPRDLLDEGGRAINPARETNNTALTYFTVSSGQLRNPRPTP